MPKTTRSTATQRVTHRQTSPLHRAIHCGDKSTVSKLIERHGEKLCADEGVNCFMTAASFGSWSLVDFLLSLDPIGVKACCFEGITLLMRYAHNPGKVKRLLFLGADPLVTDHHGNTALFYALKHKSSTPGVIRELVAAGRLSPSRDGISYTEGSLHYLVQQVPSQFRLASVLFEAGESPLTYDTSGTVSPLTIAIKEVMTFKLDADENDIKSTDKQHAYAKLVIDFLNLPECQREDDWFICDADSNIQVARNILLQWPKLQRVSIDPLLLESYLNSSLACDPNMLWSSDDFKIQVGLLTFKAYPSTMENDITALIHENGVREGSFFDLRNLTESIDKFLTLGYSLRHPSPTALSPLTMVMASKLKLLGLLNLDTFEDIDGGLDEMEPIESTPLLVSRTYFLSSHAVKFLLEKGVHVGQRGLINFFANHVGDSQVLIPSPNEHIPDLSQFSEELSVPDAIITAALMRNFLCVKLLLPYYPAPPLTLLTFCHVAHIRYIWRLFPVLAALGPIPQGTRMFYSVRDLPNMPDHFRTAFDSMHRSVLSLQELCKVQIRLQLGRRATTAGSPNLPDLIDQLPLPSKICEFLQVHLKDPLGMCMYEHGDINVLTFASHSQSHIHVQVRQRHE